MDIRQLKYFISVAECLNFTKAARMNFISQTAISQQIRALEQQLGTRLFHRNNRSVQLTSAGQVFYQEAKFIVTKMEEAINKTIQKDYNNKRSLTFGFEIPIVTNLIPKVIQNFYITYPDIIMSIHQNSIPNIRKNLENGKIDVALLPSHGLESISGLTWKIVIKDFFCAVLYFDHPLANLPKISLTDLVNQPFVTIDREQAPDTHEALDRNFEKFGFTPNFVGFGPYLETVLLLVKSKMGITLLPKHMIRYADSDLKFIDLEESISIDYVVAWMKDNSNPSIPLFLKFFEFEDR
jgi:DNA-binding transcriptional LysR family regulator